MYGSTTAAGGGAVSSSAPRVIASLTVSVSFSFFPVVMELLEQKGVSIIARLITARLFSVYIESRHGIPAQARAPLPRIEEARIGFRGHRVRDAGRDARRRCALDRHERDGRLPRTIPRKSSRRERARAGAEIFRRLPR